MDKRHNYLEFAEMDVEENYNQIDGVINNVKKPSILERMREYDSKIAEFASEKEKNCKPFERGL